MSKPTKEDRNNKPNIDKIEKRVYTIEMRAAADGEAGDMQRTVSGYAPKWNTPSEVLGYGDKRFVEYFEPGAFKDALKRSDPRMLKNHNSNYVLGRMSAGTLELKEDEKGLYFRNVMPDVSYANDLEVSMRRGDIRETSFAFDLIPDGDSWKRGKDGIWERRIQPGGVDKIYDITIATYPAYPDSEATLDVALRSLDAAIQVEPPTESLEEKEAATSGKSRRMRYVEALERTL